MAQRASHPAVRQDVGKNGEAAVRLLRDTRRSQLRFPERLVRAARDDLDSVRGEPVERGRIDRFRKRRTNEHVRVHPERVVVRYVDPRIILWQELVRPATHQVLDLASVETAG